MSRVCQISAGFLPLLDSAVLVVARELGFAAGEGIDLHLTRENSWASIRDRLAVGHFNVAHMLAPMPIACNLGLTPLAARTIAPMALGLGGNAVTVSRALWQAIAGAGRVAESRSAFHRRGAGRGRGAPKGRRRGAAAFRRRASALRPQL